MPSAQSDEKSQVFIDGAWKPSANYGPAIDIAEDGTAIGTEKAGFCAPISFGKEWIPRERHTPGLSSPWMDSTVKLLDTAPKGWILAQRGNYPEPQKQFAVMLPIRAEGSYTRIAKNPDGSHSKETQAVGVDDFSVGSYSPGEAVAERIWIMTPMNASKRVVFKSPLNPNTPLTISAAGVGFPFFPNATLNTPESPFDIEAENVPISGQEILLDLKMGAGASAVTSLSKPIGLKVMKDRIVKVTVYKIARKTNSTSNPVSPDAALIPTKKEFEDHLTDLYKPQINVTFQVTIIPTDYPVVWDTDEDGRLEVSIDHHTGDQLAILTETHDDATISNIRVFIVSSLTPFGIGGNSYGVTNRTDRTCWILGTSYQRNSTKEFLMDTLGHEIGHVLVGYGHPDQLTTGDLGPAPLPETAHNRRLMCGGIVSDHNSRILVKGEWDEAEIWMKDKVDK